MVPFYAQRVPLLVRQDLDLHILYKEVTTMGGYDKVSPNLNENFEANHLSNCFQSEAKI